MPPKGSIHTPWARRRWQLQRKAQQLMADKREVTGRDGNPRQVYRYRVCMCHRGTDGGPVEIRRSPDGERATFKGVQTCGSTWHCPICAPKVSSERGDEITKAIFWWIDHKRAEHGHVYFLTYTHQHTAETAGAGSLVDCRTWFTKAQRKLKGRRDYRERMDAAGAKGGVRALEVTFGEMNGWHVHAHEIVFAAPGQMRRLLRIRNIWARILIAEGRAGLLPGDTGLAKLRKLKHLLQRCFTVQDGTYAAKYAAEFGASPEQARSAWGLARELTANHMKRGRLEGEGVPQRCGHATPWGLLNDGLDGDKRSGELFREFAVAFHGCRQLYWSKGLREFFELGDLSDDELAARPDSACTEHVIQIGPIGWTAVIAHNARWEVLRAAGRHGRAGVEALIEDLKSRPGRYSGEYTETRVWSPGGGAVTLTIGG